MFLGYLVSYILTITGNHMRFSCSFHSNLHSKVGELTVQVNTLYTLVTTDHNQIGQVVRHDQTINRQEVNTLINMQQQLSSKLQEIR